MENKIKIILFASLIAAMIIPITSNASAAQTTPTYDPDMVDYLTEIIQTDGILVEEKTLNDTAYKVVKNVTRITENMSDVTNKVFIDGEKQSDDKFTIIKNSDMEFTLISKSLGIDETFTNNDLYRGIGSSSSSGAAIWLSDSEYGSVNTLNLYDNYNACTVFGQSFNEAVMQADVKTNVVDVTWEANPFYLHFCFSPHEWEHGNVNFEGQTHYLDSEPDHSDRRSSHAFTNTLNTFDTYRVDTVFYYGG